MQMKNLLYKEFKLNVTPICYVFVILTPLFTLIPNYPGCIAYLYFNVIVQMLFLGPNIGISNNDMMYSLLLPTKKRDIIKGKLLTLICFELATVVLGTICGYIAKYVYPTPSEYLGLTVGPLFVGVILFSMSIFNLIFIGWYFKDGKSFTLPFLVSYFTYVIIVLMLSLFIPLILYLGDNVLFTKIFNNVWIDIGGLVIGILSFIGINVLTNNIAGKAFEKVDF